MVYSEKWTSYTVLLVLTRPYGGAWRRSCAAASIIAVPTQFQRPLFYIAHRYSNTLQFPKNSRTVTCKCNVRGMPGTTLLNLVGSHLDIILNLVPPRSVRFAYQSHLYIAILMSRRIY